MISKYPRHILLKTLYSNLSKLYDINIDIISLLSNILSPIEINEFILHSFKSLPMSIRVNNIKIKRKDIAKILIQKGINIDPITFNNHSLIINQNNLNIPIGATSEYLSG